MYIPLDGPATYGAITVGTTAVELRVGASVLSDRKLVTARPTNGAIYYGWDSSVTTATGTPIYNLEYWSHEMGSMQTVYLIAAVAGINVRITEVA